MYDTTLWIASFRSGRLKGPDGYTEYFTYFYNQKFINIKSGDLGGHRNLQRLQLILLP